MQSKTLLTEPDPWVKNCLIGINNKGILGKNSALDIGAGNLRHSRMLVREFGFQRVIAVDPEPTIDGLLEPEIEVRQISAKKLLITPNSQDVIIMWALSHLLPRGQVRDLLKRIRVGLKTRGLFFGTFFTLPNEINSPLTRYSHEMIESAFMGLRTVIIPVEFAKDLPVSNIPGAAMQSVMVYKE